MQFSLHMLYEACISLCVSFCIGIMLNAKPKISFVAAVLGGICYGVFAMIPNARAGYFAAAMVLALLSEVAAKLFKTPTTIFIIIGIYPLVPGIGLYKTMMNLARSDYQTALSTGGDTVVFLALMATAIALVSILFGKPTEKRFKKKQQPPC